MRAEGVDMAKRFENGARAPQASGPSLSGYERIEGVEMVPNPGTLLSEVQAAPSSALLFGLSESEIELRAGQLLNFDEARIMPESVPTAGSPDCPEAEAALTDEQLFDFEVTDELREMASGYETLGDQIAHGWVPNALLADIFYPESDSETE